MSSGTLEPVQFGLDMLTDPPEPTEPRAEDVQEPAVKPQTPKKRETNPKLTAKDWRREFKARLKEVNKELKRLQALKAEKSQLERFLKAAETTVSVVRGIRDAG